ncbi:Protein of unknown function [Pyronema omphalodes CBS 100304]|uniref:Uncharacterized protein n=1 Tax=Pyronema omphalodes (strain CBS 100304) TaxID=1076935 RepID=U4LR00_PYROM|nr:Protein of unknown function [Pyronema omphalodes CBS 100304]
MFSMMYRQCPTAIALRPVAGLPADSESEPFGTAAEAAEARVEYSACSVN